MIEFTKKLIMVAVAIARKSLVLLLAVHAAVKTIIAIEFGVRSQTGISVFAERIRVFKAIWRTETVLKMFTDYPGFMFVK